MEGYTVRILKNVLIVLSKQLYLSVTSVQATKEMSIGREAQIRGGGAVTCPRCKTLQRG